MIVPKFFIPNPKRTRGFTLVELLVAAIAGAILLAATAGIVVNVLRVDREESGRSEVQAELTQAVEFMQRELSEAIYVYNDAITVVNPDPLVVSDGSNGIPDLNELLYDPGWIRRPDDSIPVVAFWKLVSIPDDCYVGGDPTTGTLRPEPPLIAAADPNFWPQLETRRLLYSLVVYYLRRNYSGPGNPIDTDIEWEGNARIVRYELDPLGDNGVDLDDDCASIEPFFLAQPEGADFLSWPDPTLGQVPAQGNDNSQVRTLTSNIFSSRGGRPQLAPDCPVAYSYGATYPEPPSPFSGGGLPGAFPGIADGTADASFYTCVRIAERGDLPQDVILSVTGISLERSDPGTFRRYISGNPVSELEIAANLHPFETLVLTRGAVQREGS